MGKLEKAVRADIRRTKINKAIIGTIAVAGVISIAILAPNLLSVLGSVTPRRSAHLRYSVSKSIQRLARKDYIVVENGIARLTRKGEKFAALLGKGTFALKRQKRWDNKWRVLIFDIPERRKHVRLKVRTTLHSLGLRRLQDSVWVYPHDCEDLVNLIKTDLNIGDELRYIVADKIENDISIKRYFGLVSR